MEQLYLSNRHKLIPAASYPSAKGDLDLNLIEMFKTAAAGAAQREEEAIEQQAIALSLQDDKHAVTASSSPTKVPTADTEPVTSSPVKNVSAPASPVREPASPVEATAAAPAVFSSMSTPPQKTAAKDVEEDLDALMAQENALLSAMPVTPAAAAANPPASNNKNSGDDDDELDLDDLDDVDAAAVAAAAAAPGAGAEDNGSGSGEDW